MSELPTDLIDLETARRDTGYATATIRSWIRYRQLKAWKRGYYNMVSRAELVELIARKQAIRPASPPYGQDDGQGEKESISAR